MRIETALKRRDRAISNLRDQFSSAAMFGTPSSIMNEHYGEICSTTLAKTPHWVRCYVDGYRAGLTEQAYRTELVFGGFVDGRFYSTHRGRPDYYETNGINPCDYADDGRVQERGHYWRRSIDAGTPKPFFK